MRNVSGDVGAAFRGRLFVYNENKGHIPTWGGYHMRFVDEDDYIRIGFSDGRDDVNCLRDKLSGGLDVPKKYRDVVKSVDVREENGELFVDLCMRLKANASGRVQNEDKLFHAVYHVAVKPVLRAIFELKK